MEKLREGASDGWNRTAHPGARPSRPRGVSGRWSFPIGRQRVDPHAGSGRDGRDPETRPASPPLERHSSPRTEEQRPAAYRAAPSVSALSFCRHSAFFSTIPGKWLHSVDQLFSISGKTRSQSTRPDAWEGSKILSCRFKIPMTPVGAAVLSQNPCERMGRFTRPFLTGYSSSGVSR
jgi:hypothetical protein